MEYNTESTDTAATNGVDEDERKIFVGGLSWQSTDKDIRSYFEKFGAISKVTLKTDNYTGESRGFGFVVFEDASSIDAVLAETTHTLNGKTIGPRRAKTRPKPEPVQKVFIGGLDPEVPESDIRAHFEMFGTILEIDLPVDKSKSQRRAFAFVKFENEEIVDSVIASNNSNGKQTLAGKEVDIKKHTPKTDDEYHAQFRGRGRGRGGPGFMGRGRGRGGFGDGGYGGYGGYGGGYGAGYGGYEDYSYAGYGGYAGGYDYSQDYSGGYGYGAASSGFGKAPRGQSRGRGRGRGGFAPY